MMYQTCHCLIKNFSFCLYILLYRIYPKYLDTANSVDPNKTDQGLNGLSFHQNIVYLG